MNLKLIFYKILTAEMFILVSSKLGEGCKGSCGGNVIKFENTKKFNIIGTKPYTTSTSPIPTSTEKENFEAQNNKKELEFIAKLDNKVAFKDGKFSNHKNLYHKTFNVKNHARNLEKELLLATEKLKALLKPIRIHTKKPTHHFLKLQRKRRSMNPNEQTLDLADNLRYGTSFDTKFDDKFGHRFDLSPTGNLITQGFVNNSRNGNENDYLTRQGHKFSSSPEEPSKLEEWNVRKGRGSGYDTSGSQGYANQYFVNPAAASALFNNPSPPYSLPYRNFNDGGGNYPLVNQPNYLSQPYDRVDPRVINQYGQANAPPPFGYNSPFNFPMQGTFLMPPYYYPPHIPNGY